MSYPPPIGFAMHAPPPPQAYDAQGMYPPPQHGGYPPQSGASYPPPMAPGHPAMSSPGVPPPPNGYPGQQQWPAAPAGYPGSGPEATGGYAGEDVRYDENGQPMVYDRGLGKWVIMGAGAIAAGYAYNHMSGGKKHKKNKKNKKSKKHGYYRDGEGPAGKDSDDSGSEDDSNTQTTYINPDTYAHQNPAQPNAPAPGMGPYQYAQPPPSHVAAPATQYNAPGYGYSAPAPGAYPPTYGYPPPAPY